MNKRFIKVLILVLAISASGTLVAAKTARAASAKVSVTYGADESALSVGDDQLVTWKTQNFPAGAFVNINLIRKISDSPMEYELVRQISQFAVNDGEESWKPAKSDTGENLFIEVTCAGTTRFKEGCTSGKTENNFAVRTTFGSNMAGVFSAFLSIFGI